MLKQAIKYFEQATKEDPRYALAYAGLSDSYCLLGQYFLLPPGEAFRKAKAAALKAVEADEMLAEAHTSLAYARLYADWDWAAAGREFERAIELNNKYATARHWYSEYLAARGEFDKAIAEMKVAQGLDPQSIIINTNLGWILYLGDQPDAAIVELKKVLEMEPHFFLARNLLWQSYVIKGMYEEALDLNRSAAMSLEELTRYKTLREAYDSSGWEGHQRKTIELAMGRSNTKNNSSYGLATCYAQLGETDQAIKLLRKSYEYKDPNLIWLKVDPFFKRIRSDPRFMELLRDLGLEPEK